MPEKFENNKKAPEEVSRYMAKRLTRERPPEEEEEKKQKLTEEEIQHGAMELMDLTLEKEDLLRQKISDEKVLEKDGNRAAGPEIDLHTDFNSVNWRRLHRGFSSDIGILAAVEESKKELEKIERRIQQLAGDRDVARAYEKELQSKIEIIRLARQVEGARGYLEDLDFSEQKLLTHRNNEDVKLTKADKKVLEGNAALRQKIEKQIREWMALPEVYYEVNRRELLDYKKQLLRGGIVETPSVKKEIAQVRAHLALGIPVFLRGHLGAGKTELVLHIARKYYGVEPEFISGSEEATKYDIYGKVQLGQRSKEQRIIDYEVAIREHEKRFPDTPKEQIEDTKRRMYDGIVNSSNIESYFQYGPLVRAMKEGKPLIIDEMDGIPHSILMRLNHVLTRKAGDTIKIQENSGEEIQIKEGFCVMATGNVKSARYKREELDAALLSRWWSSEIKYLPRDETMKIIAASLIDKRGGMEVAPNDFGSLKMIVRAAEEIQKIFTAEKIDVFGEGGDAGRGIGASLEKSVLSMRDLWNIVKPWKAKNFDKPLNDYIHTEFIKKATVPKDAIYLTQLFCRFGFFKDWQAEQFGIAGLNKKKLEAFKAGQAEK